MKIDRSINFTRICDELQSIGIHIADNVLATVDLGRTGFWNGNSASTTAAWIDAFRQILGENGSLLAPAFTKSWFFKAPTNQPFHRYAQTTSGALSNAMVRDHSMIRSKHPTNSWIGFGPLAKNLLLNHDQTSFAFEPIGGLINEAGKHLMMGTIDQRNAPMSYHYAQQLNGYTRRYPFCGLRRTWYVDESDGQLKIYKRKDCGGCSSAGHKFFSYLIDAEAVKFGRVGNAMSALIDGKKALEVVQEATKNTPRVGLCDDPKCISCFGRFENAGVMAIWPYANAVYRMIGKRFMRSA